MWRIGNHVEGCRSPFGVRIPGKKERVDERFIGIEIRVRKLCPRSNSVGAQGELGQPHAKPRQLTSFRRRWTIQIKSVETMQ